MMVVPTRMMGQMVKVKVGGKEEEETMPVDNYFNCTHTDKVECLDCRMYQACLSMEDGISFGAEKCFHKGSPSNTDPKECFVIEN